MRIAKGSQSDSVRQALWKEYLIERFDFGKAENRPWKAGLLTSTYLPTPDPPSGNAQALATRNVASFASNASGMHNKRSGFIVGIGVGLSGRVGLAVGIGVGLVVVDSPQEKWNTNIEESHLAEHH